MPRFFLESSAVSDSSVVIEGADARHIARSLRMAVGDEVICASGDGYEYLCRLALIRDERCEAEVLEKRKCRTESPVRITLFMAYPKGDKLETVIQKAVELGASRIVPFESSRCIKKPKAEKAREKTERLSRIAEEAAKQCGRGIIPEVSMPVSFRELVSMRDSFDLALFCYEGEGTQSVKAVLENAPDSVRSVAAVVGSEGGFSPDEAALARDCGFIMTGLGKRILRCETAPDFVLSAISYRFEL